MPAAAEAGVDKVAGTMNPMMRVTTVAIAKILLYLFIIPPKLDEPRNLITGDLQWNIDFFIPLLVL
ncbi:MAG: hypothetical protein A2Z02_03275 [Chloroflexi bacterium RBG_16_48_7]|nr:MAG: hypothetical protein A2Z02_03275 [Chloroflexi bacterium RBG_16_48_7]